MDQPIAQRIFVIDGNEVHCCFYQPYPRGVSYHCRYTIDWPDSPFDRTVDGIDAVQALLFAMQSAHIDLLEVRKGAGPDILWCNQSSLGLPLAMGLRHLDPDGYF